MSGFGRRCAVLILCAVFLLVGALAVAAGVLAFGRIARTAENTNTYRTALAYIGNQMRRADFAGGLEVARLERANALVVNEPEFWDDDGNVYQYCTYIYAQAGALRELYTEKGYPPDLQAGAEIMPLDAIYFGINANGQIICAISHGEVGGYVLFSPRAAVLGEVVLP